MSNRPAVANAFGNLKPTIVRTPQRSAVTADAEARLLETVPPATNGKGAADPSAKDSVDLQATSQPADAEISHFPGRALLMRKKRQVLVPVTFRMPQNLKEKLERVAKDYEINQTDLINEAIDLNLQRYIS